MLANVTDEQLDAMKADPAQSQLNEKDKAMLLFVLRAVKSPEAVEQKDVDALHDLGWTDQDILEAPIMVRIWFATAFCSKPSKWIPDNEAYPHFQQN